ncbi:hypothetical protein GYMLUDRAFT_841110 [Collybiopsis luxurians FD-317 M1]|uniref:F-box domain-containing protein n=1 Tax=Collybiopsis luxurians FD-317 M1 TaxID=944289 RepID=A0A0D0AXZ2_9AGAR|nr:hypothetical protein GYMLUDRAFT_841110 [Collybiopsis luxurians FD-317 M1]
MTTITKTPVELAEIIIDHLYDAPKALAACALVSPAWTARARHLLFGSIQVDLTLAWRTKVFLGLLTHPSSTILGRIHSLDIICGISPLASLERQHNEPEPMPLDSFLSALTFFVDPQTIGGISRLRLSNLDFTTYPLDLQRRISATLSRLHGVLRLSLENIVMHDMRQLNLCILRAFPQLQKLETGTHFLKYGNCETATIRNRKASIEDWNFPEKLNEIELYDDGMATVLAYIGSQSMTGARRTQLHKLSVSRCSQEMVPNLSSALHALSATLTSLRISFLRNKHSDEYDYRGE